MRIPEIAVDQRYWLVRTLHGDYYDDFVLGGFIGVGWNAVSSKSLGNKDEAIREMLLEDDPEIKQPGYAVNQMRRFVDNMMVGDLVLVPSEFSKFVSFGRVTSEVYEESEAEMASGACPYTKRRSVEWLKTVRRVDLDPYLFRLFYSQHVITSANDYEGFIDRTLHSFFLKGEKFHLVLHATHEGPINARVVPDYLGALLDQVAVFNKQTGANVSEEDIQLKINVQSPGSIELIAGMAGLVIGVLAVAFAGGKISFTKTKEGFTAYMETPGLLDKISAFLDAAAERRARPEVEDLRRKVAELSKKLGVVFPEELTQEPTHDPQPENIGD